MLIGGGGISYVIPARSQDRLVPDNPAPEAPGHQGVAAGLEAAGEHHVSVPLVAAPRHRPNLVQATGRGWVAGAVRQVGTI